MNIEFIKNHAVTRSVKLQWCLVYFDAFMWLAEGAACTSRIYMSRMVGSVMLQDKETNNTLLYVLGNSQEK